MPGTHGVQFLHFDGKCQNKQMFPTHFCASSYRFRAIKCWMFYFQKVGHGNRVQFLQFDHSMQNVTIYKCLPPIFVLAFTFLEI